MRTRGYVVIAVWLATMLVAIVIVVHTPFSADMSAFLPRAPTPQQQALVEQLRDGVASRILMVAVEGAAPATRASLSRQLAKALRERREFVLIDNGEGGIGSVDQQYVWRNRYVLSPAVSAARFSVSGLREALEHDLALLASGMEPLIKDTIVHDPTGEAFALASLFAGDGRRTMQEGVWTTPDGGRALLLAQTHAAGFDIDGQELALNAVHHAFVQAQRSVTGGAEARLVVSGPGVFGVKTRDQMKHDVSLYSTAAVVVIVTLLLALYRSPRVLVLTMLPVVSGALAGLAAVRLWSGFVHGITVGFGVTLIGESVDYAIYLFVQSKGQGGTQASLERIWPTLRLGALVSITGFLVMVFSSFTGFMQLGIFTMVGLATALAVTRFVLPRLVPEGFAWTRDIGFAPALLTLVQGAHRLRPLLLVITVSALIFSASRHRDLWHDELESMSPLAAADQLRDRDLRRDMGAPDVRYLTMVSAPTREAALQLSERMAEVLDEQVAAGVLAGYDAPHRYLPSVRTQNTRKAALPEGDSLRRNLAQALVGLPFHTQVFEPFIADLAVAKADAPVQRRALEGSALALKVDALLSANGDHWTATLPLRGVASPQRLTETFATIGDTAQGHVDFIDLKAQSDLLLHRYRHETLVLAACGSLAIAALLWLYFRSFAQCARVLLPLVVSIIITFAVLIIAGGRLSIFNLFGLLLVIAVGSNYCLFFQRGDLYGEHGARTVTSLLVANACTVIGFGALSLSRLPVLFDIGCTVAVGTALSLVAAAVFTPGRACGAAAPGRSA